ncbi:MAG: hypothetical protein O3A10_00425 [Chloroflexi bacterium]|nr:hypothetical protein [Chloroflexota bacterium]MDA1145422.1 hypothetical protein [Chloroflexota bacterium]
MARVAELWEQRIHDDPALKGLDSTARLHILNGAGSDRPHPHGPERHTHHAA